LERAAHRLGDFDAHAAAADPLPFDFADAEAGLADLRGQLLAMQSAPQGETSAHSPNESSGELAASLAHELHLQRAGSATTIAKMEKEILLAKRRWRKAEGRRVAGDGAACVAGQAVGFAVDGTAALSSDIIIAAAPLPIREELGHEGKGLG